MVRLQSLRKISRHRRDRGGLRADSQQWRQGQPRQDRVRSADTHSHDRGGQCRAGTGPSGRHQGCELQGCRRSSSRRGAYCGQQCRDRWRGVGDRRRRRCGEHEGDLQDPQLTLTNYSGPARVQGAPASDSILDAYRFGLEQFASITAGSLNVPTVTAAMAGITGGGTGEITYSGLTFRNINRGKIDSAKVDRAVVVINVQQPRPDKVTSGFSDVTIEDFDANVVIAALNPEKANDDSYHRVYRQISTAYTMTSTSGIGAKIGRILVEDIEYQPSKFRPGELLAVLPKDASASQNPAQIRELMEKVANLYEGARVGKVTIADLSMDTPQGAAKLNAIRYSQGEFALAPATLDLGNVGRAQIRVALANVPHELFSADPAQVMGQAARVEAGTIELSLRDNGGVDSSVTQYARGHNLSRDAARQTLVGSIKAQRDQIAGANPDAGTLVDAIASFVETPGQTLVIKLTPRAKVPLMQLM